MREDPQGWILVRRQRTLKDHGITLEEYEFMVASQGGLCAICGDDKPGGFQGKNGATTWNIDHDHSCCPKLKSCNKCRRGLLCARCNLGVGYLKDSEAILLRAAEYIRNHKQQQEV